jgi:hypothetical protein
MIKIIFGVVDSNSDCVGIFPLQDGIRLLNLVKQDILKNDVPYEVVGNSAHTFYCVGDFYVFSKIKIVYGGKSQRISYRAFIVALEKHETDYNVLEELDKLENQHTAGETIQQDRLPDIIKSDISHSKNTIIAVYYNGEEELEKYFIIDDNYKQYNRIYFIDKNSKGKSDPIKALKNCHKFDNISMLNSNNYNHEDETNQEESNFKHTFEQISKNRIVIFSFGILLGIIGFWAFNFLSSDNKTPKLTEAMNKQIFDLNDSITNKNYQIADLQKKVQTLADSIKKLPNQPVVPKIGDNKNGNKSNVANELTTESKTNINEQLLVDLTKFLQEDCKTMTLDLINQKINSFPDWKNTKNLLGFANFLELMKKNPPNKQHITEFINVNKINFNEQDEYVKFVRYMSKKEEAFFDSSTKNIRSISTKTLQEIETTYGYNK